MCPFIDFSVDWIEMIVPMEFTGEPEFKTVAELKKSSKVKSDSYLIKR